MSPSGLCSTLLEADRVISTFLFDPNLESIPQNLHRGESSGPPESLSGAHEQQTRVPLEHDQ